MLTLVRYAPARCADESLTALRYALEGVRRVATTKVVAKPRERVRIGGGFFGG